MRSARTATTHAAIATPSASVHYSSEKMTGYSALLLSVFVSPATGLTLTWTDVFSPNGRSGKSLKVTVFVSPDVEDVDRLLLHDRRRTLAGSSASPRLRPPGSRRVFLTATSNARSVEALIVVSVSVESWVPAAARRPSRAGAVDAGGRAAGRGAVDAQPDRGHRARRVELDVLDEHRRRAPSGHRRPRPASSPGPVRGRAPARRRRSPRAGAPARRASRRRPSRSSSRRPSSPGTCRAGPACR